MKRWPNLAKAQRGFEDKAGAAADGDEIVTSISSASIDGEAFEGGAAKDATVVIGSKQFIPGFEEQLVGAKAGEERSAQSDTSRTTIRRAKLEGQSRAVRNQDQAGARAEGGRRRRRMGRGTRLRQPARAEGRAAAAHRERALRSNRARRLSARCSTRSTRQHDFELPPRMVEAEFGQIWRQVEGDRAAGRARSDGRRQERRRICAAEYRNIAERRVRLGLLLAEIGRRHKIEVSDEEVGRSDRRRRRGNIPGQERQIFEAYQTQSAAGRPGARAALRREGRRLHPRTDQGHEPEREPRRRCSPKTTKTPAPSRSGEKGQEGQEAEKAED